MIRKLAVATAAAMVLLVPGVAGAQVQYPPATTSTGTGTGTSTSTSTGTGTGGTGTATATGGTSSSSSTSGGATATATATSTGGTSTGGTSTGGASTSTSTSGGVTTGGTTGVVTVVRTVDPTAPAVAAIARPAGANAASGLARTGAESLPLAQLGVALVVVGFLLALLERNRRAARTTPEHLNLG